MRRRGSQAGGWEFDLDTVLSYLAAQKNAPRAGRPPSKSKVQQAAVEAPAKPVEHEGEATAKQRKDHWAAATLEDNVRRKRGELVERDDVRMVISTMLVHLSKGLDTLPDLIVQRLALQAEVGEKIVPMIDELRSVMKADLAQLLG